MLVHQILKSKATAGVVTIQPGKTVTEAAQILSEKRIGTLVVSATGDTAEGVLSERDIVREIGRRGPSCMSDRIEEMMTPNPVTCAPNDNADTVLRKMTEGRFRHMPVVEDGKMVGIVTLGDAVKARLQQVSMEKEALEGMIMGF